VRIPTSGQASVLALLDSMPGDAIGLAGPRDVGKSTGTSRCSRGRAGLVTRNPLTEIRRSEGLSILLPLRDLGPLVADDNSARQLLQVLNL
jgi:hypothetical protein